MSNKNRNIFLQREYSGEQMSLNFGEQSVTEMRLPVQKTTNTIAWVEFGTMTGWVNQQPQYYDYIKKSSPKNNAILAAKTRYVYGKGLVPEYRGLNPTQKLKLSAFLSKIKRSKTIRKTVSDRNDHNAFAIEVIFSKDGKIIYPAYLPVKNIRISKPEYVGETSELKPPVYYYTNDWSKGKKAAQNKDFTEFLEFDWGTTPREKSKRYIIYFKGDGYDDDAYALPDYVGGVPYIDADCEVANFVKNNTKNGFAGGYLVNFFDGQPNDDQKKAIVTRFDEVFHGTDNAGKSIKSFNPEGGKGVEVTPLNGNGQDDRFTTLNNFIRDEIFTAHTVSPLVVGMKGDNGFANNADEKRTAIEAFTEDFVYEKQEIFNELISSFLEYNSIAGSAHLQRLSPIKPTITIDIVKEVATRAEMRQIARDSGYDLSEANDEDEIPAIKLKRETIREFSDEDANIIQAFSECGSEDDTFKFFEKRDLYANDIFDAAKQAKTFAFEFANSIDNSILKLLAGDPALTVKDIASALKITPKLVTSSIDALNSEGLLEGMQPTSDGAEKVKDNEIKVVYKYELRDDAPALVKGGKSREFCEQMVKLSKTRSWTFEDIQAISNRLGYDVFARRGGWYHNPKTDRNTPYCRHMFSQRLIRMK